MGATRCGSQRGKHLVIFEACCHGQEAGYQAHREEESTGPHSCVVQRVCPKAYSAMCELVGGEEKIDEWCKDWKVSALPKAYLRIY